MDAGHSELRWAGNEDGTIPYENWNVVDRHGFLRWRPVGADTPSRKSHWFWHPNGEARLKNLPELLSIYEQTIGRGGQLMLVPAPDRRGLLSDVDVKRLEEFGAEIRNQYAENLVAREHIHVPGDEAAFDGDQDSFWFAPNGSRQPVLEADFAKPVTFNRRAVTMEWLNDGQHVERYRIEAWNGKNWSALVEDGAIGHKRIDIFAPVTASRVRLHIVASSREARIREFQLFNSRPPFHVAIIPARTRGKIPAPS